MAKLSSLIGNISHLFQRTFYLFVMLHMYIFVVTFITIHILVCCCNYVNFPIVGQLKVYLIGLSNTMLPVASPFKDKKIRDLNRPNNDFISDLK